MESCFGFLANSNDVDLVNIGRGGSVSIQQTEHRITNIVSHELNPTSTRFNRCMHRRDDGRSVDCELDQEGCLNSRHILGTWFRDGWLGIVAIV